MKQDKVAEKPDAYPINPESEIAMLYKLDFRIGVTHYDTHRFTEALELFVHVLEAFKGINSVPEDWRRDVEYYAYKAMVMAPGSMKLLQRLHTAVPGLIERVAADPLAYRARAVRWANNFSRLGLRIHDAIEHLHHRH